MRKLFFLSIVFVLYISISNSTIVCAKETGFKNEEAHKIGLTLSGGGARGFAHIGVLHIIDSLGIEIDYVSGTSMGALIGGMYASGYTASEIEEIILEIDWEFLFSSKVSIAYLHPRKRENSGRNIVSLPFENRKFVVPTGAIEGQQLWNALGEVFFLDQLIDDFSSLNKPFACVATDLETGEPVIIKDGGLITALRASMAVPSVFTAVERNNRTLIDGGPSNNFPIDVAIDLGADFTIGVNTSLGLRPASELRSPLDIIYQMGFFQTAKSFSENLKKTDLYLEPNLNEFSSASFNDNKEIIEAGKIAAREYMQELIKLSKEKSGKPKEQKPTACFIFDEIAFEGLQNIKEWYVRSQLDFKVGDTLTAKIINNNVNRLFSSGYFNRITYTIIPSGEDSGSILVLKFDETPHTRMGVAFNYRAFTGVGLIGELSNNKLMLYNASANVRILIGEKPALKAELDFFIDQNLHWWLSLETEANYLAFPLYSNYRKIAEYYQTYWNTCLNINYLIGKNSYASAGIAYYNQSLRPQMFFDEYVKGNNNAINVPVSWKYNSLDRHAFPNKGKVIDFKAVYYFHQSPSLNYFNSLGEELEMLERWDIKQNDFFQSSVIWEYYVPVNNTFTSYSKIQGAYSYFYNQGFLNMFNLGGTSPFLKNQLTFAGLNEYGITSQSIFSGGTGLRYSLLNDFYLSAFANAAVFDIDFMSLNKFTMENFIFGAGLDIGYLSAVGPLELTIAYSPQKGRILAYLNLGWSL